MNTKKTWIAIFISSALYTLASLSSCAEDPNLYQDETLYFESSKDASKLDLDEENSDSFFYGFFAGPYAPWPLFEYYKHPLPVAVPINPLDSLVDWVHPMYVGLYLAGEFGRCSH